MESDTSGIDEYRTLLRTLHTEADTEADLDVTLLAQAEIGEVGAARSRDTDRTLSIRRPTGRSIDDDA